ncbi:MAG: nuclear transport factor 2 family protein [Candidatus Acidiferrales bacterium]
MNGQMKGVNFRRTILRPLGFAVLAMILSVPAFSQEQATPTQATPGPDRSEAGVLKVERDWLAALQHNNAKTLQRILAAEWVDNSAIGRVFTRDSFFARPAPNSAIGLPMTENLAGVRVRLYGDIAIATGTVEKQATEPGTGKIHAQRTIFTDVFIWRDARWQAVSSQETFVPGTPE